MLKADLHVYPNIISYAWSFESYNVRVTRVFWQFLLKVEQLLEMV